MKGYRTIIVNVLALIFSLALFFGLDISAESQGEITAGVLAVANIALRFITDTPVGQNNA